MNEYIETLLIQLTFFKCTQTMLVTAMLKEIPTKLALNSISCLDTQHYLDRIRNAWYLDLKHLHLHYILNQCMKIFLSFLSSGK